MRQNAVLDATSHPFSLAITPCENELFAADGQIMVREGSHNVKIYAENFTFYGNAARQNIPPTREHFH